MRHVSASGPARLLWLFDSLGAGGAESLAVTFARSVDPAAYRLTVAALSGAAGVHAERLRADGVQVVDLLARSLRDRTAFRRLLQLVRKEQIDLIHAHLTYSSIWSALVTRSTGVPSLASLHVAPSATRALHDSLRHRISVGLRDRLMIFMMNRWSTGVIAVSAALREDYVARGLKKEKVTVVHNGVDLDRFRRPRQESRAQLAREFALTSERPIVATVSVLRPRKGVEVLLEAIRTIPGADFLIIGDGSERERWTALAESLGVSSRIRWAGYRTDVDALLAGCDLFVHPSLDDAFPTVLLEAMGAGLPVIASRVGGIPEIVDEGLTGWLVAPGDAPALSAGIRRVLADQQVMHRMQEHARQNSEQFSTRAWLERLTRGYREIAAPLPHHERGVQRA